MQHHINHGRICNSTTRGRECLDDFKDVGPKILLNNPLYRTFYVLPIFAALLNRIWYAIPETNLMIRISYQFIAVFYWLLTRELSMLEGK